jgi:outer membrane protein
MKFGTLFAAIVFAAAPVMAADRTLEVAGWYVFLQPSADAVFNAGTPAEPFDLTLGSDTGYGLSANFFLGNRVSTELAIGQVKTAITLEARDREANLRPRNSTILPVTATIQYHFAPDAMIDPYIGAGAAYTMFGKVEETEEDDLSVNDIEGGETGYLANAGLSVELTEQFGLLIDAKYIASGKARATLNDATGTQADVDFSPIIVSIGFAYRF